MAIKPTTRDPMAMMREGYHEPERVFPPPPTPVLEGDLDDRAYEMLELIVWVWRISQHSSRLRRGVDFAVLQRWYSVEDSDEKRGRIYAGLELLVSESYLREGPRVEIPIHSRLTSDHFIPTKKAYELVDRRQSPWWTKVWLEIADRRGGVAAMVAAVVAGAVSGGIQLIELLTK